MATRADFYILHVDNSMEFLGSTSNEYYGDFEKSTTENHFRKSVNDLLVLNQSLPGKWYWPWKHSKITDEVFIFKITPSIFNKRKGVLMSKTYTKDSNSNNLDSTLLPICKYEDRYEETFYNDGYYDSKKVEWVDLPIIGIR